MMKSARPFRAPELRANKYKHEAFSQKERKQNSTKTVTFWVLRKSGGVGGLPREGVVAEKFVLSLESLSSLGSKRGIWYVPGI